MSRPAGPGGPTGEDLRSLLPLPSRRDRRTARVISSTLTLIVIGLAVGLILALVVGGALWALTTALHHAAND